MWQLDLKKYDHPLNERETKEYLRDLYRAGFPPPYLRGPDEWHEHPSWIDRLLRFLHMASLDYMWHRLRSGAFWYRPMYMREGRKKRSQK